MHKNMHYKKIIIDIFAVTFREEGVDWNPIKSVRMVGMNAVTFREEGVDWNSTKPSRYLAFTLSPSARKVWIEICKLL